MGAGAAPRPPELLPASRAQLQRGRLVYAARPRRLAAPFWPRPRPGASVPAAAGTWPLARWIHPQREGALAGRYSSGSSCSRGRPLLSTIEDYPQLSCRVRDFSWAASALAIHLHSPPRRTASWPGVCVCARVEECVCVCVEGCLRRAQVPAPPNSALASPGSP